MSRGRKIAVSVGAVFLLLLVVWGVLIVIKANTPNKYGYRIEYTTLPLNDDAYTAWLQSQPGVTGVSVSRDGNVLITRFRLPPGSRLDFSVENEAVRFGYGGQRGFAIDHW